MTKALITVRNGAAVTFIHEASLAAMWISQLAATLMPPTNQDKCHTDLRKPTASHSPPLMHCDQDQCHADVLKATASLDADTQEWMSPTLATTAA